MKEQDNWQLRDKTSAPPQQVDFESLINRVDTKRPMQEQEMTLVVDNSKKEIGTLMKLNSLQKRLKSIEHIIGGWKPGKKNPSVTAQVEYTQKKLDLLKRPDWRRKLVSLKKHVLQKKLVWQRRHASLKRQDWQRRHASLKRPDSTHSTRCTSKQVEATATLAVRPAMVKRTVA